MSKSKGKKQASDPTGAAPAGVPYYDLVVLGDEVGGLLAANLAREQGLSVLVVPGKNRSADFSPLVGVADCEPNVLLWPQCLRKAQIEGGRSFSPALVNSTQRILIRPGVKLDQELAGAESARWERQRAEAAKALTELLDSGPGALTSPSSFIRGIRSLLKRFGKDAPVRGSVADLCGEGLAATLGLGRKTLGSPLAALPLFAALSDRCVSFRGGPRAFRGALEQAVENAGGKVLREVSADRVRLAPGAQECGFSVEIGGRESPVSCGYLILAMPIGDAHRLFETRMKKPPLPHAFWFTSQIEADRGAFPIHAVQSSIWIEKGAPPLWIETADAEDYGVTRRDRKVVFLRTPVALDEALKPSQDLVLLAKRMRRLAAGYYPFLEGHHPQASAEADPAAWNVEKMPASVWIFKDGGRGTSFGVKGAWHCGPESHPECGVVGPLLSAHAAITEMQALKAASERKASRRGAR